MHIARREKQLFAFRTLLGIIRVRGCLNTTRRIGYFKYLTLSSKNC